MHHKILEINFTTENKGIDESIECINFEMSNDIVWSIFQLFVLIESKSHKKSYYHLTIMDGKSIYLYIDKDNDLSQKIQHILHTQNDILNR